MSNTYVVERGTDMYEWLLCEDDKWRCTVHHGDYAAWLTVEYDTACETWVGSLLIEDAEYTGQYTLVLPNKEEVMHKIVNVMRGKARDRAAYHDEYALRCAVRELGCLEVDRDV